MLKKSREREREKFSGSLRDLCLGENVCNEEECEEYDKEKRQEKEILHASGSQYLQAKWLQKR